MKGYEDTMYGQMEAVRRAFRDLGRLIWRDWVGVARAARCWWSG